MGDKGAVGVADDVGEGMQCMDHPYRVNPGGICAFCLQEKLGKLVSSSKLSGPFFPLQPPLSPSSSSSPASSSFRSDAAAATAGLGGLSSGPPRTGAGGRSRMPFLAAGSSSSHQKKKSGIGGGGSASGGGRKVSAASAGASVAAVTTSLAATAATTLSNDALVLKRSKSVAPRPVAGLAEGGARSAAETVAAESPRKKSFWSFLYSSSPSSSSTSSASNNNNNSYSNRRRSTSSSYGGGGGRDVTKEQQPPPPCREDAMDARKENGNELDEAGSPSSGSQASSSFGRKVARSRSVGCGSRSFSGDFLERISTGLGDCALRRVESHREAKAKIVLRLDHGEDDDDEQQQQQQRRMKERVKCGGLFGGFGMMSSSIWLSAGLDDDFDSGSRISATTPAAAAATVRGVSAVTSHGRTRSWGWTFASPMRAFRPASTSKHPYAIKSNAAASAAATAAVINAINANSSTAVGGRNSSNKLTI